MNGFNSLLEQSNLNLLKSVISGKEEILSLDTLI